MRLDPQTLDDLDVLARPGRADGLLDHLDRTRTRGGRDALRRRLTQPLDTVDAIDATQDALRYLMANPGATAALPDQVAIDALRRYLGSRFITLRSFAGSAVFFESAWIRWRDPDLHRSIAMGLGHVAAFLAAIRRIAMELGDAPGPLRECVETLWSLVHAPDVARLEEGLELGLRGARVFVLDRAAREVVAPALERMVAIVHEIDALAAVARAAHEHGWIFPTVSDDEGVFRVDGLRHPFLEAPVPSDVDLGADGRMIFLTGPNMAGKTTWLKAIGVTALLAHAGMPVPADACRLGRMDRIISAIRTEDDLRGGVSYFQAEARRVRTIAEPVAEGLRCLVIVDELFRGTNVKDACDASLTVVRAFARAAGCRFLVASHLTELATELDDVPGVVFLHFEARLVDGDVAFDYRIRPGVSVQRLGMKVLEREGVVGTLERIPA